MQASPLCSVKWRAAHNKWAIILPNTIPDTPIIGVTSHSDVSRSNPKNSPLWHIVVAVIEIRLHLSTIACPLHTCLGAAKWRSYFVFPLWLIWPGPCSIFHGDAKDYWKWGCCTDALISHWVYYNLCVWKGVCLIIDQGRFCRENTLYHYVHFNFHSGGIPGPKISICWRQTLLQ